MEQFACLVESLICGFEFDAHQQRVCIQIKAADGLKRFQILATGVDDFLATDVRASNIIDRLHQFSGDDDPDGEIAACVYRLMFDAEPGASNIDRPEVRERVERIRDGLLDLWILEPVYGASITILAAEIRLSEV